MKRHGALPQQRRARAGLAALPMAAVTLMAIGPVKAFVACGGSAPVPSLPPPEYEKPVVDPWQSDAGTSNANIEQGVAELPAASEANTQDAGG